MFVSGLLSIGVKMFIQQITATVFEDLHWNLACMIKFPALIIQTFRTEGLSTVGHVCNGWYLISCRETFCITDPRLPFLQLSPNAFHGVLTYRSPVVHEEQIVL